MPARCRHLPRHRVRARAGCPGRRGRRWSACSRHQPELAAELAVGLRRVDALLREAKKKLARTAGSSSRTTRSCVRCRL